MRACMSPSRRPATSSATVRNRKYDCADESHPGVGREKLTPEQAAKKVVAVASAIPQMTVLGIAGPGDPLANPDKTFKTFELVSEAAPDIKLCLSTNGLALPDHIETIEEFNVDHVTIAIDIIDPDIGARSIRRFLEAQTLHRRRGRAHSHRAAVAGPGNADPARHSLQGQFGDHPGRQRPPSGRGQPGGEVAQRHPAQHHAADLGAEHGTVFGLNGRARADGAGIEGVAGRCEGEMNMMRHCRQCRADAVGLLGEDRSAEFTAEKMMEMEVDYDLAGRQAYQALVEEERGAKVAAKRDELETLAGETSEIRLLIAVATKRAAGR